MPKIDLPYKSGHLGINIDGSFYEPSCKLPSPLSDIAGALEVSVNSPVSSPPLKDVIPGRGRISILVPDMTRGSSVKKILPHIMDLLASSGVRPERIEILVANGTHRIETERELTEHLGGEITEKFRIYQHRPDDPESHIRVGATPANSDLYLDRRMAGSSLILPVSSVSFHYFAGFGGGRKMIMPGMADRVSILRNHRLSLKKNPDEGLSEGCRAGNLGGNPVHRDMVSAVKLLKTRIFMINLVADPAGNILFINSGDIFESHRRACEYLTGRFTIRLDRRFSVVAVSCGGSPKDINLLQVHKTLRYASAAAEKGADIYCIAACYEGIGSSTYREAAALVSFREEDYTLNTQTAVSTRQLTSQYNIFLQSELDERTVRRFGFQPWKSGKIISGGGNLLVLRDGSYFLPEPGS
ncbi:MAG: nickel-dependent lactate racemase [Candidatus Krumholzibacteriales bacterium]